MAHTLLRIMAAVMGVIAVAGIGYLIAVQWCVRKFGERLVAAPGSFVPPVSILKPLKGIDPQMYESFRSHCLQDYPAFEIIFGVNHEADPAIEYVERLRQEFPQVPIRLIICSESLGTNRKVSNLIRLSREAKFDYLIVNDADIRVPQDYLQRVMAPFADPKMGLVSALYRAVPGHTISSQVEALAINTEFAGGILMAINMERAMKFALGSTLAFSGEALDEIGGFKALVDFLADDYELGNRIAHAGFKTELADVVVDTFVPDYTLNGMLQHQLRWARTIRDRRAAQYVGLGIVYAVPWALIALFVSSGAAWAWLLFLTALGVRLVNAHTLSAGVLKDSQAMNRLRLVPIRDCIALAVWAASFFGDTITWRDETFRLKAGKLYRV